LRDVEKATGISNAYLSQLETGKVENPSPHVLHKLADFYKVPYESLMQAAGYLKSPPQGKKGTRKVGAIQAALMSVNLTDEEEKKVVEFVEFLRMQRRQKKG
jgi:transcriptional regulator with XRE-family HTH domain